MAVPEQYYPRIFVGVRNILSIGCQITGYSRIHRSSHRCRV